MGKIKRGEFPDYLQKKSKRVRRLVSVVLPKAIPESEDCGKGLFECPVCNKLAYRWYNNCPICGSEFDWSEENNQR